MEPTRLLRPTPLSHPMAWNTNFLCTTIGIFYSAIGLFAGKWTHVIAIISWIVIFELSTVIPEFWHGVEGGGGTDVPYLNRTGHVVGMDYLCSAWALIVTTLVAHYQTWPRYHRVANPYAHMECFAWLGYALVPTILLQVLNLSDEVPYNAIAAGVPVLFALVGGYIWLLARTAESGITWENAEALRCLILGLVWAHMSAVFLFFYVLWFFVSHDDSNYWLSETGFQLYGGLVNTAILIPAVVWVRWKWEKRQRDSPMEGVEEGVGGWKLLS